MSEEDLPVKKITRGIYFLNLNEYFINADTPSGREYTVFKNGKQVNNVRGFILLGGVDE